MLPPPQESYYSTLLQRVAQDDPSLTILNGSGCGWDNTKHGPQLTAALLRNTHLVVIFLQRNPHFVCHKPSPNIYEALARHQSVEFVYLSYTPLGDVGAVALSSHVTTSKLRHLKAANCGIGPPGALALGRLPCLQVLDLDGNCIGAAAASKIVATSDTLQSLSLRYTGVFDLKLLEDALEHHNVTLTELFLQEDECDDLDRSRLDHWLSLNRAGRRDWGALPTPSWPRMLSKTETASVMYGALTSRPDIVCSNNNQFV